MKPQIVTSSEKVKKRVNPTVQSLPSSGIRRFFDLVANTTGVISLGVGEPDFSTPWHITELGIHSMEIGHTSYTSNNGMLQLREELAIYLHTRFGIQYDPEHELLVTVGGSEAIDLAFRTILVPGDEVIVIDPSFVAYAPLVVLAGGVPLRVGTQADHGFVPTIDDLERVVTDRTRAMIINYPNNPTGATLSQSAADAIAEFVVTHDLLLISDEIYQPLAYEEKAISMTVYPALHDRLILVNGFSKAWAMTGWRLGFAAGPEDILAGMGKIHQYAIMCASTSAQYAALEALRNGQESLEEMRNEYDRRRRYIVHHFNHMGLDCMVPKGAFYAFPSIRTTGLSSEDFSVQLLKQEKVAVVPGTAFGECGEGYIRCSYATSMSELKEAVTRIRRFVESAVG